MNINGMKKPGDLCNKCNKREVETIDDWVSDFCGYCNDRLIENYNERKEFDYYHPKK